VDLDTPRTCHACESVAEETYTQCVSSGHELGLRTTEAAEKWRVVLTTLCLSCLPAQRCTPPAARARIQISPTSCGRWRCRRKSEHWSLTTLHEKLVQIGARIVRHGRYVVFQLAEVRVPRALFAEVLRRIDGLRLRSPPLPA
jgi:hypothetical protein